MIRLLFQHTATLGVRGKYLRPLRVGSFGKKCADFLRFRAGKICRGLGDPAQKAEYDDLARIAAKEGISLQQARDAVEEISEK